MNEKVKTEEKEVQPVKVIKKCPKCSSRMEPGNRVIHTNPPKYPHSCVECGYEEMFNEVYPRIEHREVK